MKTNLQKCAKQAFARGTLKNFMTTREAGGLLDEAMRDGKVTAAEREVLTKVLRGSAQSSIDEKKGGAVDSFESPTLSAGASTLLSNFLKPC